jgi:predicted O-methyltransferase YrrM
MSSNQMTSPELWTAIDEYIDDLFVHPDAALDAALEASDAAGLPRIAVSPSQGKTLHILARLGRARRILEIGTLGGYSAIWMGRALPHDGRLITLEADAKHADVARGNIARAGLDDVVEVRLGRALDTLPALAGDGSAPFDLVFIDADKAAYPDYLHWSLELTKPGSLIVADNVIRHGRILDTETDDADVVGTRRFNELLAAEPRVTATVIQTVGVKQHDGFAIAIVN